jgi:N-glycosylase/DNA lyase
MTPGEISGSVPAPNFDLELSMDCGQIFGWTKEGKTYRGMIGSAVTRLMQLRGGIGYAAVGATPDDIAGFLGLDHDFDEILRAIAVDTFMEEVTKHVRGLRLFRQDPWHCLCSYILSANNRVDRIDSLVKQIARRHGKARKIEGKSVYSLPRPEDLAGCGESRLRACGVGFRAPYILSAAGMVADGIIDFDTIDDLGYDEGRELLKTIPGVGDKIADCVLLFAFAKYEAFPVDVWIKRAVERVYFGSRQIKPGEVREFGRARFGKFAGYAQEYIYHYARAGLLNESAQMKQAGA